MVGTREGSAYEIGRRYLGSTEHDKYQLFGSFPGCRGVTKEHEVCICDRIILEMTVFRHRKMHFLPTLYSCIAHSFSKISPVQDQYINR